jgi:hypothetical protein
MATSDVEQAEFVQRVYQTIKLFAPPDLQGYAFVMGYKDSEVGVCASIRFGDDPKFKPAPQDVTRQLLASALARVEDDRQPGVPLYASASPEPEKVQ